MHDVAHWHAVGHEHAGPPIVPVEAPAPPAARETYKTPPHRPAHDLATGAEIAVLTPELSTELGRARGMDVFRMDDDMLLTGVNPDPVK